MRPPARALDCLDRGLRGAGGCGQRRNCQEYAAKAQADLQMEAPQCLNRPVERELAFLEQQERAEQKPRLRCPRPQKPRRELVPRQNTPAGGEEERADRMAQQVIFCGAASARASICACKAFNTDESVGSMRGWTDEPGRTAQEAIPSPQALDPGANPLQWR